MTSRGSPRTGPAGNDDIQADFTLDWMGMMDHLTYVTEQVASGVASPAQVAAYAAIQADLRAAEPTLRTLELHVPAEILAAVPPSERRVSA